MPRPQSLLQVSIVLYERQPMSRRPSTWFPHTTMWKESNYTHTHATSTSQSDCSFNNHRKYIPFQLRLSSSMKPYMPFSALLHDEKMCAGVGPDVLWYFRREAALYGCQATFFLSMAAKSSGLMRRSHRRNETQQVELRREDRTVMVPYAQG
jgi:hypothetical protein